MYVASVKMSSSGNRAPLADPPAPNPPAPNPANPPAPNPAEPAVAANNAPPPDFYRALVDRLREPRNLTIKSIPCDNYRSGSDFDLWVVGFVDTVRASHNITATDARLNALCINWIFTKLASGATRSVYDNLSDATKQNWPALKQALSEAFKDESEEIKFLSRDDAFERGSLSLIDYKNGLLHRMQKYQPNLKAIPSEWQRALVRRFLAGLKNPVLSAHILMTCRGQNHTLDQAYSVATNYENTIETITQGGDKSSTPNMAAMLNIPQMASLSLEPPQFSVLSTQQEKTNERLSTLETASRKHELDITEVKTGLTEVKDSLKSIKEEIVKNKLEQSYARPVYQRQVRPVYPVSRMPLSNYTRPFTQQGSYGVRPRVVQGLTGGPGYVAASQAPMQSQAPQSQRPASQNLPNQSTQIGQTQASPLTFPQRPPGPAIGAMSESETQDRPEQFANPHLQYGSHDMGLGWSGIDYEDAHAQGYDLAPEGMFVYSDLPF